jgi:hypothetical protein
MSPNMYWLNTKTDRLTISCKVTGLGLLRTELLRASLNKRLRVEGGQLGSGQNVLRVLSGQAVFKGVLNGDWIHLLLYSFLQ